MAPIAVPVIETTSGTVPVPSAKKGTGDYKEQAGGKLDYDSKLEEQGENKARVGTPTLDARLKEPLDSLIPVVPKLPSDLGSAEALPTIGAFHPH